MDPILSSTGASTEVPGVVTPSGTTTVPSVNPAQTTTPPASTPSPQHSVPPADVSALIAQYEARIRNLMSEKDKAINERNTTISQLTTLQKEYDDYKAMNSASLNASVENAQRAIDDKRTLEQQIAALQGEVLRAKTLLEKPHLAPYAQFIPAVGDAEKVKAAVEQLEQIRASDLARMTGTLVGQQQQSSSTPQGFQGPAGTPPGQVSPEIAALYAGRQNLPSSLVAAMPGSTPAATNPAAMMDPNAEIARLFAEARTSSDPGAFDRALAQAQVLANAAVNQQLGRSS